MADRAAAKSIAQSMIHKEAEIRRVMERQRQRDIAAASGITIPFSQDDVMQMKIK